MAGAEGEVRVRDDTPAGVRLRVYSVLRVLAFPDGTAALEVRCNTGNSARIQLDRSAIDRIRSLGAVSA